MFFVFYPYLCRNNRKSKSMDDSNNDTWWRIYDTVQKNKPKKDERLMMYNGTACSVFYVSNFSASIHSTICDGKITHNDLTDAEEIDIDEFRIPDRYEFADICNMLIGSGYYVSDYGCMVKEVVTKGRWYEIITDGEILNCIVVSKTDKDVSVIIIGNDDELSMAELNRNGIMMRTIELRKRKEILGRMSKEQTQKLESYLKKAGMD